MRQNGHQRSTIFGRIGLGAAVALLLLVGCGGTADMPLGEGGGDELKLTNAGEAKMPIIIGEDADASLEYAADELAEYLEKISGASFEVTTGDGEEGIVLGTPDDFAALPLADPGFGDGPFEREDYIIRSEDGSLYLLGASPLAARFAVWDLLHRFGHRQFFPTDTWEVIPEKDVLEVAIDVHEQPDYYNRQGPRGAMRMDDRPWAAEHWENWQIRNRTMPTFELSTGHAYDQVVANNESDFDSNPDYWGLVDGERTDDAQPNVAHEDVQQMFIDHALEQFEDDPDQHSVAMDPRDGNYWSEDEESLAIGGPSEQAVNLANMVAEAVVEEYGDDKYVGIYGYSHHSPPPEIDVHPNVIVSLATEYIRGGYTFEDMLDGWSEKTDLIGIREYYGLWTWDHSLPGNGAVAADTQYIAESIPYFYERGARFMNAESNDTWGGYGLGYYLASRFLWDVEEADRKEELIDDFIQKAFGPAEEPMREFYELIDGSATDPNVPDRSRPLNDDFVGRMYRLLDEARQIAAGDEEIVARIDDLILYTHYVELYRRFDSIDGPERQEAFDDLVSFAWRTRGTMMAESVELNRSINRIISSDDYVDWGADRSRNEPAPHHRDDEDEPFSDSEIEQILAEGIDNHELVELEFEPWEDSGELTPAGFQPDESDEPGGPEDRVGRRSVEAVMHTDDGTLPAITISAGHIYDDRGPLQWTLETMDGEIVDYGDVMPNEEDHHFELSAEPGKYRFSIDNTGQGFIWDYEPRGAKTTLLAGGEHKLGGNWYDRLYFYVPEGTDEIHYAGELMEDRHDFVDGDGQTVNSDAIEVVQDYTRIDVPEGQDGEVWSLELGAVRPRIRFLNIPGYVAFSPDELLLPEEVR